MYYCVGFCVHFLNRDKTNPEAIGGFLNWDDTLLIPL